MLNLTIDPDHERVKEIKGGISYADVIAYQMGWTSCLLSWEKQTLDGQKAQMPEPNFKWNQLGALAQFFYHRFSNKNLAQLRTAFKTPTNP